MPFDKNNEILKMFRSIRDKNYTANNTLISVDLKNGVIIDQFVKLIDFSDSSIDLIAADKNVYIYGENMKMTSFTKTMIYITGKINKIEISEVK